jgi:integrase
LALTWVDVDWGRNRFHVHSPKTEHHADAGERWVPIFPELRPFLEEAFELAEPGVVHVVNRYRAANQNLRTQLMRIIARAGVKPWPRLFHNLRASRQTELASVYPIHVVCAWLGNSALIAQKHYLQVTEDDFRRATETGGANSDALSAQKAAQQPAACFRSLSQETPQLQNDCDVVRRVASAREILRDKTLAPVGIEPTSSA